MNDSNADNKVKAIYSYKPSLFGAPSEFMVADEGLRWSSGRMTGAVAYADIRNIRISYRPAGFLVRNYRTEIWANKGPKLTINSQSWKSMVEKANQYESYKAFAGALHRELIAASVSPELTKGVSPYIYWPGVAFFAATAFAFVALFVRAVQTSAWAGAVFVAVFLIAFGWQLGRYFRDNRPGTYTADAVPQSMLPS